MTDEERSISRMPKPEPGGKPYTPQNPRYVSRDFLEGYLTPEAFEALATGSLRAGTPENDRALAANAEKVRILVITPPKPIRITMAEAASSGDLELVDKIANGEVELTG